MIWFRLLGALAAALPAMASPWILTYSECASNWQAVAAEIVDKEIESQTSSWEVIVDGRGASTVHLDFHGLPGAQVLTVSAAAGQVTNNTPAMPRITITPPGPQTTFTISGIPISTDAAPIWATVAIERASPFVIGSERGAISITQSGADIVYSRFYAGFRFRECEPFGATGSHDSISFLGSKPSGPTVAVVDGSFGVAQPRGCRQDDAFKITPAAASAPSAIAISNYAPDPNCPSEIALFSWKTAPAFVPHPQWTPGPDLVGVTLHKSVVVPVKFWVLSKAQSDLHSQLLLISRAVVANRLFKESLAGITFKWAFGTVSSGEFALAAQCINSGCTLGPQNGPTPCPYSRWKETPWYDDKALNVYLVDQGSNTTCDDRQVIYLHTPRSITLAHEVGHAFGLTPHDQGGHADYYDDPVDPDRYSFGNDNLMWGLSGVPGGREKLTLGQVFRMHTHSVSALHLLKNPGGGIVRYCHPRDRSPACPSLTLDVTGKIPIP